MPDIICSILLIIVPFIASLVLFFRIKKNQLLKRSFFFWHYAFGFAIFSLVHLPIFFINLGVYLTYKSLVIINFISLLTILFSYLLFYRATILLLTKDRFITTIFPLISLPLIAILAVFSLFILNIGTLITYTAVIWGFLLPNNTYLGSLFLYVFIKGAPFDTMKRHPGALILGLGWFIILASDISLWISAALYHPELWILKLASLKEPLILRTVGYLVIFVGSLLYSDRLLGLSQGAERE